MVPNNRPIAHMLRGTRAHFLQGWVTVINSAQQCVRVQTSNGEKQLAYDYLINALGSRVNRSTILGVQEYTFTLDPYGDLTSEALKSKFTAYGKNAFRVVVVGGGATGLEAATQVKGSYPQAEVSIVTQGEAGAFKGARVQKHIIEALREQTIAIHENARVNRVEQDGVVLDSGQIPADIIIWAGGFVASPLAREAGLQVNAQNLVLVDPYLRSLAQPNIYAVGDAAYPVEEPGAPTRMSVFTALGSVVEAEDVLQDAYLRVQAHATETIEKPKYYLTTIVTRLCLNQLSAARTQREQYLGPWLPEPILTADKPELVNPAEQTVSHDSISIAFLVLLESLLPAERAVFLLHEVFDYKFREIAEMLDKREAACRQLFRRAKAHRRKSASF